MLAKLTNKSVNKRENVVYFAQRSRIDNHLDGKDNASALKLAIFACKKLIHQRIEGEQKELQSTILVYNI